mgnify:CR=1 FL=1
MPREGRAPLIALDAEPGGFTLSVDGHRVFSHSERRPCAELGVSRAAEGGKRGAAPWEGGIKWTPLRRFRVEEAAPGSAVVDFEGRLRLSARHSDGILRLTLERPRDRYDRFRFRLAAVPGEAILGCGERFGPLDLKGRSVPLWVEDRGGARELCPLPIPANLKRNPRRIRSTYLPLPCFVSTDRYWVFADTDSFARFDFRSSRQTVLEFRKTPREISLGRGGSAAETVSSLACRVGRPPPIPPWTRKGAILGVGGGAGEVLRKLDAARTAGAPVAAVWVRDWCGARDTRQGLQPRWNWEADPDLYPDLTGFIASLRSEGVRFLGYVNPFLASEGNLCAEARERGLLVRSPGGGEYRFGAGSQTAVMPDLTNPRAFRWVKDVLRSRMIDPGMSGWLADLGECLPDDAVLHSGEKAQDLHNLWPVLWARAGREAIEEAGASGEIAFFQRSGWAGSSTLASGFWAGVQLSDFSDAAGLSSVVPAGLSAGLSGAGFWHFDAGGCVSGAFGARKPECLERWFEMAAFSPVFRTQEGNKPLSDCQYWTDPACLRHFVRMAGIFAALEPYHAAAARECSEAGLPPIRHLWTHYEEDPEVRFLDHQYLYGRDLLVCPVFRKGQELKDSWLPPDRWVHFWTSRTFRGGPVSLEAPLGYPLVFYREESRFAPLFDSIRRTARRP